MAIDLTHIHIPLIQAYRKRWLVLTIYVAFSGLTMFQCFEYAIINNLVAKYYDVSVEAVSWTSMIFMIMWPIFIFPATYIIDKKGLRVSGLIGSIGSLAGSAIKLSSIGRDRFFVVLIGQGVVGVSQLFVLSIPSMLAAFWFKQSEVATVCSLSFFGMNLGVAMGFLIPPMIVVDHDDMDRIAGYFYELCWLVTGLLIPIVIAVIVYFPSEPARVPSLALYHALIHREDVTVAAYFRSVKNLLKKIRFLIHIIAFGINVGIYNSFSTLLNTIVLYYFEKSETHAGLMGMIMVISGMFGSLFIGIVLDRNHEFKATAIVVYFSCCLSLGAVLVSLHWKSMAITYITIGVFGFFLGSYLPTGIEFGTELTFPSPESTVAGLSFATANTFGIVFTIILHHVHQKLGVIYNMLGQVIMLLIGSILTCLVPEKKGRQLVYSMDFGRSALELGDTYVA